MLVLHAGLHPDDQSASRGEPVATPDEVKEYLAGNLCRCGSYVKILEAVLDAAERLGSPFPSPS